MILGDMGLNLAPVLASAGVLGVAIGFGAQNLVQDFLAGIFMLLEDQYGVGDVIDVGGTSGTVEAVSLRITRMRDVNGVVWHVRNGTISKAGNKSQGWARAVVDFPVPYRHDIPQVRERHGQDGERDVAGAGLAEGHPRGARGVGRPDAIHRRRAAAGRGPTVPLRQWEVQRELTERLKNSLDATGRRRVRGHARTRVQRRRGRHGAPRRRGRPATPLAAPPSPATTRRCWPTCPRRGSRPAYQARRRDRPRPGT